MSWSVSFIGKASKIAEALEAHSEKLSGQSKVEYDDSKPHLVGLVKQTFETRDGIQEPLINFSASGSGSASGDQQIQRNLSVKIEPIYAGLLV